MPDVATVPQVSGLTAELSFAQERMWFLEQLEQRSPANNCPTTIEILGTLNIALLQQCADEIVRRHDPLRTRFVARDGRPVQLITESARIAIQVVDLGAIAPTDEWIRRITIEESVRLFSLDQLPLMRLTAFRIGEARHVLQVTTHHIVWDAWSLGVVLRELQQLYDDYRLGRPSSLRPLAATYRDYAAAERAAMEQPAAQRSLAFWKSRLEGLTPLQLPTDYPRPRVREYRGACHTFELPSGLWDALEDACVERNVSPFMFVLAALQLFLSLVSGGKEIVVGVPIANRRRPEWEGLVGFFVNMLVFRGSGASARSFDEIIGRVREDVLDAHAHADYPFAKMVEDLNPVRQLSVGPLFQTMLVYLNTPTPKLHLAGLDARLWYVEGITAKQDLTLTVSARDGRSLGVWEYNTALFHPDTMARFARQFVRLLELLVENRAASPALLRDSDEEASLRAWNETDSPQWRGGTLSELVQLEQPADRVALVCGDLQITYGTLRAQAAHWSGWLTAAGVGPEKHVGVLIPRSPELIVGMLAVFGAGGSCVPVDESWPLARIRDTFAAAGVDLVLCAASTRDIADLLPMRTLELTGSRVASLQDWRRERPAAANCAYVTFTSGSTGTPKGIEIPRDAVWSGLQAMGRQLDVTADDVFVAVTTASFDIAVQDWALPLIFGGRVVLVPREQVRDPQELASLIARAQPSFMQATPSLWRMLVDGGWAGDRGLQVLTGGEALPDDLASWLRTQCGDVWNLYGTSETTLWSMAGAARTGTPDLGAPLANTAIHLLSRRFECLPRGFEGEIFIAGIGVARGYLRNPALTAERFLPDPLADRPGARMFRTGDLARWGCDGRLRLISRADAQVKVRGIRIEPGEVESCVRGHPAVQEAAVCLRRDADVSRLIGYITLQPDARRRGRDRLVTEVVQWVRQRLPEYMVPAAFVVLDAFPLTTSGKIDRNRLPAPVAPVDAKHDADEMPPLSPIGQAAQAAWKRSLGRDRVSLSDHFFDLAGNSILAAQVCLTVSSLLGIRVPVRLIFEYPVFGEFAARLEELRSEEASEVLPEIEPDHDHRFEPFPLTDVQEAYLLGRSGVFELGEVATHSYFELETSIDVDRFEAVCQTLIRRHDMLRAVFTPDAMQRVLPHVPDYVIRRADARMLTDVDREQLLQEIRAEMSHAVHPADRWPLFEIRATRLTDDLTRLHFSVDALVCDAFSVTLLARECLARYRNLVADVPRPAITFRDYVLATRALESTEMYRRSERYWRDRIDASVRGPDLPLVHGRQRERARFSRNTFRLPADQWRRIRTRALAKGLSPTTVVLAAFSDVLACWSRTQRFLLNLTLFNRLSLHPDVNAIVGDFTSITLLDVDAAAPVSFEELASTTQRRLWDDLDHRFFSGIRVLRELRRKSGAGHEVLAPVVFTSTLGMSSDEDVADEWGRGVFSIGQTPQVWLDHKVFEERGMLGVEWDFVDGLFPDGMIDAMFGAYQRLLTSLAEDDAAWTMPRRSLHETFVPAPAATSPVVQFEGSQTLHDLFLEKAREDPRRAAVVARDRTLTYGELEAWSRAYAAKLTQAALAPEELVAVVAPRGWQQAVAVLAILRAGGAYLPVEPGEPEDRRLRIMQNARVRFALTTPELSASLAWSDTCQPIAVAAEAPAAWLGPEVPGERLAYVIYTSGSTGQPKGVMIDHRAAVNTLRDLQHRLGLTAADRTLALSALSFDLSVFDCFGMWAAGGAVVYPEPSRSKDPQHWAELLASARVTVWNSVPTQMEMLVEAGTARGVALRWIMLSGDWIPVSLPPKVRERWPDAKQLSLGGATEASIWSIVHPIEEIDADCVRIPYGRALTNQSMSVLNQSFEPTPPWVIGEICIGGAGLARGYLNDPALTRERFVRHPASGARLYRTGDLGRYLPNGEIEILGRIDHQVKVSGYRVELAEIEAVLQQQHGIQQAIVNLEAAAGGQKELVAYLLERPFHAPAPATGSLAISSKLAQRAIRSFPSGMTTVDLKDRLTPLDRQRTIARQSYRFFTDAPPSMAAVNDWLSRVQRRHERREGGATRSLEWFERIASLLKQDRVAGNPFPKYRYPSAGSLYPVQAYFEIPRRSIRGLDSGIYYYDPRAHRLVRVGDCSYESGSPPHVIFVAELTAIEEEYPSAFQRFCALEAGYMRGMFLGMHRHRASRVEGLRLSSSQRVIAAYELDAAAAREPAPMERLLMWVRPSGIHGTEPGFYLREAGQAWVRQPGRADVNPAWFGRNRDLFERSHFTIVSIAEDPTADTYIDAGALGQILMEESTSNDLGLCPIGEIGEGFVDAAGLHGSIVHGWVCGRIDPAQTREWMAMPPPPDRETLRERCRETVTRHLPAYMHPAKYLFLERVPLTANQKVDRALLKSSVRKDTAAPVDAKAAAGSRVEHALAGMLASILERPVDDFDQSFFDMAANSLVVVRLYGLVNTRYPDRVSFQQIFDNPSIRAVARLIEGQQQPAARSVAEVVEL